MGKENLDQDQAIDNFVMEESVKKEEIAPLIESVLPWDLREGSEEQIKELVNK